MKNEVPIWEKSNSTIEEAAEYSNIDQNKISNLLKEPRCPFVLYVGTKKLVKRRGFERFLSESVMVWYNIICCIRASLKAKIWEKI